MLIFRQLFDPTSSTYTYLLGDSKWGEAVVIDPVFEQVRRDAALVTELGLRLAWTLETHVHADHVTGAWMLRRQLGGKIALSSDGGAVGADRYLVHRDRIRFGERQLPVPATPGHCEWGVVGAGGGRRGAGRVGWGEAAGSGFPEPRARGVGPSGRGPGG